MKRYLIFLAAFFCAVISCSQEEILKTDEVKLVPVTIFAECGDFDTKSIATWNSEELMYNIKWEANDALSVFTNIDTGNHEFTARQTEKLATFTGELPAGDGVTIYPIMPYDKDAYISGNTVYTSIPDEQDGDFYNVVLAGWPRPDTKAEGVEDFFYQFEAVSGIIKFHFDPAQIAKCDGKDQHVVRLSITADRPIAGDAKISFGSGKPEMTANPNGTGSNMYNTITISAPDGDQSLPEGDYYIATLPIKKSNSSDSLAISVKCETKEGEVAYINATIGRSGKNHILTANVVKNIGTVKTTKYVPHFTSGEFTVNNSGKKVSFSPGNLQYQASSNTWRFALNQWDAQGEIGNITRPTGLSDNGPRATQSEWIDLFPWGHTGWTKSNKTFYPYNACPKSDTYFRNEATSGLDGTDGDWGAFCDIVNGETIDSKGTWRLPTLDEFNFIVNSRTAANAGIKTVRYYQTQSSYTDAPLLYMKCGIKTGITGSDDKEIVRYGVMLFPDSFEWPVDELKLPTIAVWPYLLFSYYNCSNEVAPKYTLSEFSILEREGVVFLPSAGKRHIVDSDTYELSFVYTDSYGSNPYNTFNTEGYYWTSSKDYCISSYQRNVMRNHGISQGNQEGCSVRLVKNGTGF